MTPFEWLAYFLCGHFQETAMHRRIEIHLFVVPFPYTRFHPTITLAPSYDSPHRTETKPR